VVTLAGSRSAVAHRNGIAAAGCDGCHSGGRAPTVTLSASPENPQAGDLVTLTVTVSQTNGAVAGFYLTTVARTGAFRTVESGTTLITDGVAHSAPRTGAGGTATFRAGWSSAMAGGVDFRAYALSANGDGTSVGDAGGAAAHSIAVGCDGVTLYVDQDRDGFGTSDPAYPTSEDCAARDGYATVAGDCDDFDPRVHPGAAELCDREDNDCDGRADDDVTYQLYCPDRDGDGHGVPGAGAKMDCAPSAGFGDCAGDCDDADPAVHPNALELCNGRDDDCDGMTDEGVQPTCGLGWCRRYAAGCGAACVPGAPRAETCNAFDDDCDGVIDNGDGATLCGDAALSCVQGQCIANGAAGGGAGDGGSVGGSGGAGWPGEGENHDAAATIGDAATASKPRAGCAVAGGARGHAARMR
jgi:hypothetical protein